MADCKLLFAPHLNSYRRFRSGAHAPLTANWGYENRTVALRIPADKHAATRIEHRVAGADASPHLVYAAILSGILYGLENDMSAPPPVAGNAYEQQAKNLPNSWPAALHTFRESEFIQTYFGPKFQRVYTLVKKQEMAQFDQLISPFEYASYL